MILIALALGVVVYIIAFILIPLSILGVIVTEMQGLAVGGKEIDIVISRGDLGAYELVILRKVDDLDAVVVVAADKALKGGNGSLLDATLMVARKK